MKEIGGYMEIEKNRLPMMHEGAVALNSGRNCLVYLMKAKTIKHLALPYFLCDTVKNLSHLAGKVRYYHIKKNFLPEDDFLLKDEEWIYIVNYYGLMTASQIKQLKTRYDRIILDQAQAFFAPVLENIDTIYTCRKFFGVPDGAFLYTDQFLEETLQQDESYNRMNFLLGRFECTAAEFYKEYSENEKSFSNMPLRRMSKLTENILRGIDYEWVKKRRSFNYEYLHQKLKDMNKLSLRLSEGPFAYPLLIENAGKIRDKLIENKIYIPMLWPNVLKEVDKYSVEYKYAENILPIPCDQRYNIEDMERIYRTIINICRL